MNRSRLSYSPGRGTDVDAGGAADLQTDVMRFMAILSMCLVAIFALVQSIPAETVETVAPLPATPPRMAAEPATAAEPVPVEPAAMTLTRPEPIRPQPRPAAVALERPKPEPRPAAPVAVAEPVPPAPVTPAPSERTFTLRFESDAALTRLVARDVVGLYAITADGTQRMSVAGERLSFWNASAPREIHEMDAGTVPGDVLAAWRRSGAVDSPRWGVSLPGAMQRELDVVLAGGEGGAIIIGGDGRLRLAP